jgi:hypothetical protein
MADALEIAAGNVFDRELISLSVLHWGFYLWA